MHRRERSRVFAPGALTLCAVFALVAGGESAAATFDGLYSVVVELDPSAPDPRSDAIRRGFERVLVRVAGSREAAEAPELRAIMDRAQREFLSSYALLEGREVRIGFIPGAVDTALERASWPVWGPERPLTMLWIAVDNGFGDRSLLGRDDPISRYERTEEMQEVMETLREELETVADERGLLYALPALDITDIATIDFADVWSGYEEALSAASARYGADAIVTARVRNSPVGMDVEWTLHGGAGRLLLGAGFREGLDWLADQYAAQFAVFGGSRLLTLTINGVDTYADYGRVMSYLASVSLLERVDTVSLDRDVLVLEALSRGSEDVLLRVLGLSSIIAPVGGGSNAFGPPALDFVVTDSATRR
jgi:hypothetical protein